ncbi:MAG TPA: hypothetical protein VEQ42_01895 [Pyrinomonadaceae bacterium]|nr:hypothetical protein [Pyrinomonadaceae bacterium]
MRNKSSGVFLILGCVFAVVGFLSRNAATRGAFFALAGAFIAVGAVRARRVRARS